MNEAGVLRSAAPEAGEPITFRVLGPVETHIDGRQVTLGGPRQQTLLALLLLQPGRTVPTDELIDAMWSGEPPDGAATTIRSYVSRLRAALGEAAPIVATASGYSIGVSVEAIDAALFDREVRSADDDLLRRDPHAAVENLGRALALWRGRPFGDLSDDGPLRVEAERLEELRLHAVEQRFEAALAIGQSSSSLDQLEAAVAQYPYRERLWQLLMLALYHSGRQADALAAYRRAREMLNDQLGIDPSPELQELETQILRQEIPRVGRVEYRNNLPAPLTSFVGREAELEQVVQALNEGRLVTLTGVGGVGKTRLALEAARRNGDRAPDGLLFVDLGSVGNDDAVARATARTLEIREHGTASATDLVAAELRHARLLVVLDNCEHVRSGAADLAESLLAQCPDVRILATSRLPLGIGGEADVPVPPLSIEPDAVGLLLERARAAGLREANNDEAAAEAARICRDLDGLPLAIELAAARAKAMSLREIGDRLDDRFRFLVSWRRVTAARHQTLRHAIDWSYDLLAEDERRLLALLAVFSGGFTMDAAAAVASHDDASVALDGVTRLVDASLVMAEPRDGATRYQMLETVRQYAETKLQESGDLASARSAHGAYFKGLGERAEPELTGGDQALWFARLDDEHANLVLALDELGTSGTDSNSLLEYTVALTRFWYVRGYLNEARQALEWALERTPDAPTLLRRRGLTAAASIALLQGDTNAATRFAEESLEAARATGEDRLIANGLSNLGAILLAAGERDRAEEMLTAAVELARLVEDTRILALALNNLGDHALTAGEYARAEPLFSESLSLLQERGDTANVARSLFNLGAVALKTERIELAEERFRNGMTASRAAGDKEDLCWILIGLAAVAGIRSDSERAAILLGAATNLLRQMGADFKPFERQLHDETSAAAKGALGHERFEAASARGSSLSLEVALEMATAS